MTEFNNDSIDNSNDDIAEQTCAGVTPRTPQTKAEKITALKAQITKLEVRLYNLENDIVAPAKPAKIVVLPEVGSDVAFNYGRKTENTEPVVRIGVVVAVKNVPGKPAQVRVQVGQGFDAELITLYLGQLVQAGPAAE